MINNILPQAFDIRELWKITLELPYLRFLTTVGIVAVLASLVLLSFLWRKLPPVVPLWYSRAWGEEQLSSPINLLILPLASFFWIGLSLTLAGTWRQAPVFAKLVVLSSTIVSILSLVTITQILMLVI